MKNDEKIDNKKNDEIGLDNIFKEYEEEIKEFAKQEIKEVEDWEKENGPAAF